MYIDLMVFLVLILSVVVLFRRFDSFIYFMGIMEIFLRILTFIKKNINLPDVSNLIDTYLPENVFDIFDKYVNGTANILLKWLFVIIMMVFLVFITKLLLSKKKI